MISIKDIVDAFVTRVNDQDFNIAEDINALQSGLDALSYSTLAAAEFNNTQTIAATLELSDDSLPIQILNLTGGDRTVELAPEGIKNHPTLIYNNSGDADNLAVKDDGGSTTFITLADTEWALFFPVYGVGWKMVQHAVGYALQMSCAAFNPADATTYYFASRPTIAATTGTNTMKLYIPKGGTLKRVTIEFSPVGTLGSNETSSVYIRLNNTTDTLIDAGVQVNAIPTIYSNNSLSIAVAQGDYITIKWVTPTWATNPTTVDINANVYIE